MPEQRQDTVYLTENLGTIVLKVRNHGHPTHSDNYIPRAPPYAQSKSETLFTTSCGFLNCLSLKSFLSLLGGGGGEGLRINFF